jgi:hypothetical protein
MQLAGAGAGVQTLNCTPASLTPRPPPGRLSGRHLPPPIVELCAHETTSPFKIVNFLELGRRGRGVEKIDLFQAVKKMMQGVDRVLAEVAAREGSRAGSGKRAKCWLPTCWVSNLPTGYRGCRRSRLRMRRFGLSRVDRKNKGNSEFFLRDQRQLPLLATSLCRQQFKTRASFEQRSNQFSAAANRGFRLLPSLRVIKTDQFITRKLADYLFGRRTAVDNQAKKRFARIGAHVVPQTQAIICGLMLTGHHLR